MPAPVTWHRGQFFDGSGSWWSGDGDRLSDRTTWIIWNKIGANYGEPTSKSNPPGYLLWVWHGPAEQILGAMEADYREMKRASCLGWTKTLREAKERALAHWHTGEFGD